MTDFESRREERRRMRDEWRARFREKYPHMARNPHDANSGVWTGIFVLLIGVAALVKATVTGLPDWLFGWQTFLIALGLFFGIRVYLRGGSLFAPFIAIIIGTAFLIPEIDPTIPVRRYIWPVVIMLIGIFFIISNLKRKAGLHTGKKKTGNSGIEDAAIVEETIHSNEDYINTSAFFGGTKKNILSKNFKGGHITNIFGGTEIYLGQADINGTAVIDTTTIFGGLKLVIPSNWTVKSEAAVIFGGIEDKRNVTPVLDSPEKILLIKGTVMFGGVDIKSY